MKYNFDISPDRWGTGSLKWDIRENELPMWVADMDFYAAPAIQEALEKRVKNGSFGYSIVTDDWYDAYSSWWERRHGLILEKENLIFTTGVVPAISSIVRKLTTPNENIVLLTPVYNIFFNSIINNGCRPIECPLLYDNGVLNIDFESLEESLKLSQTTMMILCNPQNPSGRVWKREELERIGELCLKHHVVVISDEIHCDLTDPGVNYVPFASLSDKCRYNSITCIAPTKTFSIPGLNTAAVYIPDEKLRQRVNRALNTDEIAEPNAFAIQGAVAAFNGGEEWLDQLREYIYANKMEVKAFIEKNIPEVSLVPSEATYLLWIDCRKITSDSVAFTEFIREKTGLFLSEGREYGEAGQGFIRMNIACPISRVRDGLERFRKGIEAYKARA